MAHFVLVHGAFDGAWSWAHLADNLRTAGHTVLAPDLPGAGQDPTPLSKVTLASTTQRVVDCLRSLDAPAVLVGHSMGGVVVTQAAAEVPAMVAKLVYLAAFRPVDGESLLDLAHLPEGADSQFEEYLIVTGDPPIGTFDPAGARTVFYPDVPEELARSAIEKMGPQPLQLFETPVSLGDTILPPAEYVVCTQVRAVPPALQRLMAQRAPACIHELDSGHSPFYSVPGEVLSILQHAAE